MSRIVRAATLFLLLTVLTAPAALAHAGGGPAVRYELPAWVTWFTGAGVVALSFAIVGTFLTRPPTAPPVAGGVPVRAAAPVLGAARLATAAALLGVAVLGLSGADAAVMAVWLVGWGLLPVVAYLVGDAWAVLNPFLLVARTRRTYPAWLASWPAVAALLAVAYAEVSPWATDPRLVGAAVAAHVLFHGVMASVFGRAWLEGAELLTATFRWWGRMAPLRVVNGRLRWRWPGAALVDADVRGISDVAFVVALLYAVSFDAFLATDVGAAAGAALAPLGDGGARAVLLAGGYAVFVGALAACMAGVRRFAEALTPRARLAATFAPALVPIAAAYHLAHNGFGLLQVAGVALPPAWEAWSQVLLIVVGHVVAVVVAHGVAFRGFPSRLQAIRSEVPFTAVMVFYTMVGLWLVSRGHAVVTGAV